MPKTLTEWLKEQRELCKKAKRAGMGALYAKADCAESLPTALDIIERLYSTVVFHGLPDTAIHDVEKIISEANHA